MRITSAEETIQAKEAYKHLAATHGTKVCAYRADNIRFLYTLFKELVQTCGKHISYCRVVSHHQNKKIE